MKTVVMFYFVCLESEFLLVWYCFICLKFRSLMFMGQVFQDREGDGPWHKLQSGKVCHSLQFAANVCWKLIFWQLLWLQEQCGWALWVGNGTGLWWWKPKVSFWGGEGLDLAQNLRLGGPQAKRCVGLLWRQISLLSLWLYKQGFALEK